MTKSVLPDDVANSVLAHAQAAARQEQLNRAADDLIDATALAAATALQPILHALKTQSDARVAASMPIVYTGPDSNVEEISRVLANAVRESKRQNSGYPVGYAIASDEHIAPFSIRVFTRWLSHPCEDGSKFSIGILFMHGRSPEVEALRTEWFAVLPDGRIPSLDVEKWVRYIDDFLTSPDIWQPREGTPLMLVPGIRSPGA